MADVPTTEHLIDGSDVTPEQQKEALGHLALRFEREQITLDEFTRIDRMLGLIPDPDVQAREPRGHIKGTKGRLRAVPADWNRRGAVGA